MYHPDSKCYSLAVYQIPSIALLNKHKEIDAEFIFEISPCLSAISVPGERGFAGQSAGGRLVVVEDGIYLSVGDFYFDGVNGKRNWRLEKSHYGAVLFYKFASGNVSVKSKGHRNPQGLVATKFGLIETEHGPQGGDEINLIPFSDGMRDYGWPDGTFGVNYGERSWPLDPQNDRHKSKWFELPLMAFTPSVGISSVDIVPYDSEIVRWRGDLLVGSLRAGTIFRVSLDSNRIYSLESINVSRRIRDIKVRKKSIYFLEDVSPVRLHVLSLN